MFKQLVKHLFGENKNEQEPVNYDEQRARLKNTYKGETATYNYAKINHSIAGVVKVGHLDHSLFRNESNEVARVMDIARATGFTPAFAESSTDQNGFGSTNNLKFFMRGGAMEGDVINNRAC